MKVLCIGLAVMDISARPISQDAVWAEKQSIDERPGREESFGKIRI